MFFEFFCIFDGPNFLFFDFLIFSFSFFCFHFFPFFFLRFFSCFLFFFLLFLYFFCFLFFKGYLHSGRSKVTRVTVGRVPSLQLVLLWARHGGHWLVHHRQGQCRSLADLHFVSTWHCDVMRRLLFLNFCLTPLKRRSAASWSCDDTTSNLRPAS